MVVRKSSARIHSRDIASVYGPARAFSVRRTSASLSHAWHSAASASSSGRSWTFEPIRKGFRIARTETRRSPGRERPEMTIDDSLRGGPPPARQREHDEQDRRQEDAGEIDQPVIDTEPAGREIRYVHERV